MSVHVTRIMATIGICAGGTLLMPPAATAETPFDNPPPTAHFCSAGLGDVTVEAETSADESELVPGQVSFEIDEGAGTGMNVAWVNTDTRQFGISAMQPGSDGEPEAVVTTGPGHVMAAVYGLYTNAQAQTCLVTPGVATAVTVPALPVGGQ